MDHDNLCFILAARILFAVSACPIYKLVFLSSSTSTLFSSLHCLIIMPVFLSFLNGHRTLKSQRSHKRGKMYNSFPLVIDVAMGTPEAQPAEQANTEFLLLFYRRFCCYFSLCFAK